MDESAPMKPACRCEATIPSAILDGYACGKPDCWRTPIVQASFDAFVSKLVSARGESQPPEPQAV